MTEFARDRDEGRKLDASLGKKFYDLDVATHRAIMQDKNGLESRLAELSITDTEHPDYFSTQIPEYFESFDVRKSPSDYVEGKLYEVIHAAF